MEDIETEQYRQECCYLNCLLSLLLLLLLLLLLFKHVGPPACL